MKHHAAMNMMNYRYIQPEWIIRHTIELKKPDIVKYFIIFIFIFYYILLFYSYILLYLYVLVLYFIIIFT